MKKLRPTEYLVTLDETTYKIQLWFKFEPLTVAVSQLTLLVGGLSLQRPGFAPNSIVVGFGMVKVALRNKPSLFSVNII
jgi:hypothetical protein